MLSAIKSAIPQPIRKNWWEIRAHGVTPYVSRRLRNLTAQAYLTMGVRRVCPQVNGVRLWVDLLDPYVGRLIYTYRTYEPASTAYLKKSLTSGMVFVDVGAHVGYFTALAAGLVGTTGRVIAIEPEQYNYSLLAKTIADNGLMNTVAVNAAAGAAPGSATLHVNSVNLGDHRIESNGGVQNAGDQQVKMMRLDDIIADSRVERVDIIKIDVQGFEWHVTRGMDHTMTKFKPRAVICEYWPHGIEAAGGNPAEMFSDFQRWGYRCRTLEADRPLATYEDLVDQLPPLDQASPDSCYLNVVLKR